MPDLPLSARHKAVLTAIERRMNDAGLPELAIRTFGHYFHQLAGGQTGLVPETDIRPVESIRALDQLPPSSDQANSALGRCVTIKLNGGLGTSMGLNQAKSLLPAREGMSFLELITRQILHLRRKTGQPMPLLLMNSYNTETDSLGLLSSFPELQAGQGDIPLSLLQHKVPRLLAGSLEPVSWPPEPHREWCPPGHGDLYTALVTSGLLEKLLGQGYRWAFVANADNLGASLDTRILDLMASQDIPFLMEVTRRTPADCKGGHVALDSSGQLILRESAQCPQSDLDDFQNIGRHRYFNTNNLWLDLKALKSRLDSCDGVLGLPLICNRKHVIPHDRSTPAVIQAETAMGAAIGIFEGAEIIEVPRSRFAPVKTTNDLLVLWSDRYRVNPDYQVVPVTDEPISVELDSNIYGHIDSFRSHFPAGAPSLIHASQLSIRGDIQFGADITIRGRVRLVGEPGKTRRIADGCELIDVMEDAKDVP
jgi:UTP--glucose-1-phosphate uridylyltransferase